MMRGGRLEAKGAQRGAVRVQRPEADGEHEREAIHASAMSRRHARGVVQRVAVTLTGGVTSWP